MIRFGIVGGGWRSEFYLRVADALPELFEISGIYLRNEVTRAEFSEKYNIPIFDTLDPMLDTKPDFVVSCVNKGGILEEIELLSKKGVAVLSETPAGISLEQIKAFKAEPKYRVQIAEQFHLMPKIKKIVYVIDSGILGEVNYVYLSCCHDYHAVSLARILLGVGDEIPDVTSIYLPDRLTRYNGRRGTIKPELVTTEQKLAVLKWGDKTAVYDFNKEQYFSGIRSQSITVRGTKGEIVNDRCTYLEGRELHTVSLSGIPSFEDTSLSDDEKAVAECLIKMDEYLKTGKEFYPLERAMRDVEISLKI